MPEHVDVLIIGAGLSGIAAGYHLQRSGHRYLIVEARESIGGTWDLFRYPGVRSDSDMLTLGYSFRPWRGDRTLADGASILEYVRSTAREFAIDRNIRFGLRVTAASWSSSDAQWTVTTQNSAGESGTFTCKFLVGCSGYYAYDAGFSPDLPGLASFGGAVVHPQHWPADLDVTGKRVVVVGSGATAITLVPALAETAAHVTMLQRSPTYVVSRPAIDAFARRARRLLPDNAALTLARWRNIALGAVSYSFCRAFPGVARRALEYGMRSQLPDSVDAAVHFHPRYAPWDQRLCLVPDADLFRVLSSGRAEVVTDTIVGFEAEGVKLASSRVLPADLLVTATGLRLQFLGGVSLVVDGKSIAPTDTHLYKGTMLAGVPNAAIIMGYTNASWTLKAELSIAYVCRVLTHMQQHKLRVACPQATGDLGNEPLLDFTSGYVRRGANEFPRQGSHAPWRLYQNYLRDIFLLRHKSVDDGVMKYS